jgi:LCP family protein required for cell wall assembly
MVSIPRDTLVYEPACPSRTGGGTVPAIPNAIIDGAMNQGGPVCAVATVEHLTGIRMDHFVRFDFNSFRAMVNVLGGVEVCLPQAVHDRYSHLYLAAGRHLVTGNQALAFVRTRAPAANPAAARRQALGSLRYKPATPRRTSVPACQPPIPTHDAQPQR